MDVVLAALIALPVVVGAWTLLKVLGIRRKDPERTRPRHRWLAAFLIVLFASLFALDAYRGLPLLPLAAMFAVLLVPVVACAWKARIFPLLLLAYLAAGLGVPFVTRWDWRWRATYDRQVRTVPEEGCQVLSSSVGGWEDLGSFLFPLLSAYTEETGKYLEVWFHLPGLVEDLDLTLSGATVAVEGGAPAPTSFLDPMLPTGGEEDRPVSPPDPEGPEAERATGPARRDAGRRTVRAEAYGTPPSSVEAEVQVRIPPLGRQAVIGFEVAAPAPEGEKRWHLEVRLERRTELQLKKWGPLR